MRRLFSILLCLMLVAATVFITAGCSQDSKRVWVEMTDEADASGDLTVAFADAFSPFVITEEGKACGIDVETAKAVSDDFGDAFTYTQTEWDAAKKGLDSGKYDAVTYMFLNNEIKEQQKSGYTVTKPYYESTLVMVVHDYSYLYDFDELTADGSFYKVGVKENSAADHYTHQDISDAKRIFTFSEGTAAIDALINEDVDCVVTERECADEYIEKNKGLKIVENPYNTVYRCFVTKDQALADKLDATIAKLSDNGTFNSIEEKYISSDISFFSPLIRWFNKFKADFELNFINKDRWKSLLTGLGNTLQITLFAAILGVFIGIIVASIRTTYDNNKEDMKHNKSIGYHILKFFNALCKIYLTIIRGTPVVVQLLIIYFIIFASSNNDVMIATLAFGINSGAYVAEILRGGIMSIDKGQFEAGRSIGFNYFQTMAYIIIPQVLKNVLPTLLNEFIALLKETSVAGYVGVLDLTRAGNQIRGATFSAFLPLIAVALIYLLIVMILTWIVGIIERRLRKSER